MKHNIKAAVVLLLLANLVGCAGAARRANTALSVALQATNAARDSFTAWDRSHQLALVNGAQSAQQAQDAIQRYRVHRDVVLHAFVKAYAALSAAATVIPLIERGDRSEAQLFALVAEAAQATQDVKRAIAALRGDP